MVARDIAQRNNGRQRSYVGLSVSRWQKAGAKGKIYYINRRFWPSCAFTFSLTSKTVPYGTVIVVG